MLRRRQINAGPGGRARRALLGIADSARWRLERLAQWLARPFERLAWPFERFAWTFERRLAWPLRERSAGLGPSGRIAGAGALVAVAVVAVLAGVLLSEGNGAESVERTGGAPRVAVVKAGASADGGSRAPALQGAPPSFGVSKGVGVAKDSTDGSAEAQGAGGDEAEASAESGEAAAAETGGEADASAAAGAATASSAKPVPAGPEAMRVARRFSEAFVFYEIGQRPARVKAVFEATATPALTGALEQRPPRLPQRAQVPKAKVVNLVPGPRRGQDYTVSVSLLRVGLTSELRITMHPDKTGTWRVSEILG
jgi:hypothetical protein